MLFSLYNINNIKNNIIELEEIAAPKAINMAEMDSLIHELKEWMLTYALAGDDQRGDYTVKEWIKNTKESLNHSMEDQLRILSLSEDKEEAEVFQKIQEEIIQIGLIVDKVVNKKDEGVVLKEILLITKNEFRPLYFSLTSELDIKKDLFVQELDRLVHKNYVNAELIIRRIIIIFLSVIFLISILGFYLSYSITKSIKELHRMTEKVMAGDLKAKVSIKSKDELGRLGNNFNLMTQKIADDQVDLEDKIKERTG
ncbi:MAG: HAMP domain-containing protein, partial [Clostridiales bacterium]|nr:HAMP domain-containing protein [Clostridiales bacterium]